MPSNPSTGCISRVGSCSSQACLCSASTQKYQQRCLLVAFLSMPIGALGALVFGYRHDKTI